MKGCALNIMFTFCLNSVTAWDFHTDSTNISIMSKPTITRRTSKSVTIELTVHLDPSSMLRSEDNILEALNGAGRLAAQVALEQFDTDGSNIGKVVASAAVLDKHTFPRADSQTCVYITT